MVRKGYFWHFLLILYIIFIFSNSLTPAAQSSENSGWLLHLIHEFFFRLHVSVPWLTEHVLRKCAHFSEYSGLGVLLWISRKYWLCHPIIKRLTYLFFLFLIPFVDETLQLFTEGRSGQISDVWLDISGIVFGTLLMAGFGWFLKLLKIEMFRWDNNKEQARM